MVIEVVVAEYSFIHDPVLSNQFSVPMFLTVLELSLVHCLVANHDLLAAPIRSIVVPLPLVDQGFRFKDAVSVCFLIFNFSLIEAALREDEDGVLAVNRPLIECSFQQGAVVEKQSSFAVDVSIHPFPFVVCKQIEDVVGPQLHSGVLVAVVIISCINRRLL